MPMTAMAADEEPFVQPNNPVIKSIFTADPEAHVWPTEPNKLYIYSSHDPYPYAGCNNMDMYHVFSTENMVDFEDEGEILRRSDMNDLSWITPSTSNSSFMWAPDAAYKDGWYYFYFPVSRDVKNWGATWETGVLRSRYPDRDFERIPAEDVDANPGKPWLGFIRDSGSTDGYNNMYDVCVRVYDGEAYIYNGAAQTLWQGKLKDDMVTLDGKLELVSTDNRNTANNNGTPEAYNRLQHYHEGPSAFRRQNADGEWVYYLIYPGGAGTGPNGLSGDSFFYCMADSPLGPWEDAQIFFNPTGCGTSHGSITEFNGKWYWFYHTQDLSNIGEQRSVSVEEVIFNDDGSIQRFSKTSEGVLQNGPDYEKPSGYILGAEDAVIDGTGTLPVLSTDPAAGNGGAVLTTCGANNTTITFNDVDGGETGSRARLRFHYSTPDAVPKLQLFVNGVDYKGINFPKTGGNSFYSEIELTTKRLNPGKTNTIQLSGINQGRMNLNYIEVILLDDEPAPGYFDLTVTQTEGGTAEAKWSQQDAGESLNVAAGSKVTLSYDEGAGEFDGWEVVKPEGLVITDNSFYMPYGEVEVKPIFDNEGNARRPIISTQPKDVTVIVDTEAELSVEAMVKDSGVVTYQWYSNTTDSNVGGTEIAGATSASFKPSTAEIGTFYYYVVITNTNADAVGSEKTAFVTSDVATVQVDPAPSTECDIVSIGDPFEIDGTDVTATVSNHVTAMDMNEMVQVSDDATWMMYSDAEFTTEALKVVSPVLPGDNVRYIRVTAQDGITTKDYTVTITRETNTIGKVASAVDGTIDPASWGGKVFTLAEGLEGTEILFGTNPPKGFNADIYLTYDENNLYLGLDVTDPNWTAAKAGANLWQGCGIQLNLWSGRDGGRSEYGFGLTADGPSHYQWSTASGATTLPRDYSNYEIKRIEGTDTFIYTIAIPLDSFRKDADANPLTEGEEVLFSLSYNYPSATNMDCAFNMGFHSKALNDARYLMLGSEIAMTLTTDAHNVKAGDYFNVNASFISEQASNVVVLNYTFDGDKFEYANYTPADGIAVVDAQYGDGFAKITLMAPNYKVKQLGDIMLHAKEDAALNREQQGVQVNAEYVLIDGEGVKTIKEAAASTSFTTIGNGTTDPVVPGDTNDDGILDLIDLSNMIDWFGTTSGDEKWDVLCFFDFNNNGEIDISDIAYLARQL
ncbi:family 43 glycosylhydrolase [Ligaoa zhengdingensis]|uniref:family 43 glycosylhydrolase n=3 Tax=Ligaoa zhengdingensis TaxID=2763658 RepID=UPI0031BB89BE